LGDDEGGFFMLNKEPSNGLSRNQWEEEREQLLSALDSALASGFHSVRQDLEEHAGVLTRMVDELRGIKERLQSLEDASEPARRRGGSPLDKIRNKEAREFWEEVFGEEETEVKWSLFQTCLAQRFRWLKEVVAIDGIYVIKEALDVDKKECVSIAAFAAFSSQLGLERALAQMLPVAVAKEGFTCLMQAATHGKSLDLVKELCELGGADLIHAKTKDGSTCLFCAAFHGHIEIAKYLCKVGGQLLFDAMQLDTWRPIDVAAHNQNDRMVEALKLAAAQYWGGS